MKSNLLIKNRFILLLFSFFVIQTVFAQAPQKMSYQAVIRNSSGALVTSAPIGMRVSILQGSENGTAVYVETQAPSTNINGLVTIEIGTGTVVSGAFSSINWGSGPFFIKTETDPNGGINYSVIGTSQLASVPYALFAANAGVGNGWSISGNSGTNPSTNYVGTSDDNNLVFKRNNIISGQIDPNSTAFGHNSLNSITGFANTAFGSSALQNNTTGFNNTSVGFQAMIQNTTGGNNTAIGLNALEQNTTGDNNSAIGLDALRFNTSGGANIAMGVNALLSNTIGNQNTALGTASLRSNTTANFNVAVGNNAMRLNTTGQDNTAVGTVALFNNTEASNNVAVGTFTLSNNISGANNTAIGRAALNNNVSGSNNTAVGFNAGLSLISGNNNIFIGDNTPASYAGVSNFLNLGNTLYGNLLTKNIGIDVVNPENKLEVNGTIKATAINFTGLATYEDDAAAGVGGLVSGDVYKTPGGVLMIKM